MAVAHRVGGAAARCRRRRDARRAAVRDVEKTGRRRRAAGGSWRRGSVERRGPARRRRSQIVHGQRVAVSGRRRAECRFVGQVPGPRVKASDGGRSAQPPPCVVSSGTRVDGEALHPGVEAVHAAEAGWQLVWLARRGTGAGQALSLTEPKLDCAHVVRLLLPPPAASLVLPTEPGAQISIGPEPRSGIAIEPRTPPPTRAAQSASRGCCAILRRSSLHRAAPYPPAIFTSGSGSSRGPARSGRRCHRPRLRPAARWRPAASSSTLTGRPPAARRRVPRCC